MTDVEIGKGKPKGKNVRFKCANCGKVADAVVSRPPESAVEVFDVAKAMGMFPVESERIVYIFCNEKCFEEKQNNDGSLNPGSELVREFTCKGNEKK